MLVSWFVSAYWKLSAVPGSKVIEDEESYQSADLGHWPVC